MKLKKKTFYLNTMDNTRSQKNTSVSTLFWDEISILFKIWNGENASSQYSRRIKQSLKIGAHLLFFSKEKITFFKATIENFGPAVRVFANGPGDLGSIPGRVIPKTLKMVLDTTLLNTQHYKVRFKGKVEQSWEWSSALPYTLVL